MKPLHALLLTVYVSPVGALEDGSIKLRRPGHVSHNLRTSSDEVTKEGSDFYGARTGSDIPEEAVPLLRNRLLSDRITVTKITKRNTNRG